MLNVQAILIIQNENKNTLHVWCREQYFNLPVVDCCETTERIHDFFGTISVQYCDFDFWFVS